MEKSFTVPLSRSRGGGAPTPLCGGLALQLVSFKDHRCQTTPTARHVCVWEGDADAVFRVLDHGVPVGQVTLNDHDARHKQWHSAPDARGDLVQFAGDRVSGFADTGDLQMRVLVRTPLCDVCRNSHP